jgi:hypothetical protein
LVPSKSIIRVFAVSGPCRGLQFMDTDTGRVLAGGVSSNLWYIYRLAAGEVAYTDFGPSPTAHFDHAERAPRSERR